MEFLTKNWPFTVGDQVYIYYVLVAVIFGLLLVNLTSALRQKLTVKGIVFSFFSEVVGGNKIENNIRILLLFLLAISFMVLAIDIVVNDMQLPN
ncbi:MAG: hypothetical protein ACRBEE_12920 [Arenicella sp.]